MSDTETSPSLPSRSRLLVTAVWVAVLTALNMVLAVLLVGVAPRSKKVFDDFNLQLSWASNFAIHLSDWYAKFWYMLVPLLLALAIGGVLVGRHLFRRTWPGNVFATVYLFLLVLVLAITAAGLGMEHMKLQEALMQ